MIELMLRQTEKMGNYGLISHKVLTKGKTGTFKVENTIPGNAFGMKFSV